MTLKKIVYLTLIVLFVLILGACSTATLQSGNEMINPGEKIGDFLITTEDGEDVIFVTKLKCPVDNSTNTESCEQPVSTKVNVSDGIADDNPFSGKTLDEYWSEQTYEMFIEGHPVNASAESCSQAELCPAPLRLPITRAVETVEKVPFQKLLI